MNPPLEGVVLNNRYQLQRVLNDKGGMGLIYQALDLNLRGTVVLKKSRFVDEQSRAGFEREARLLYGLRHSALPRVIDYFQTEDGGQFIGMEFIPGKDLSEMLTERVENGEGPFSVEEVLDWADQLLDALHYLHTHEPPVIHRDIKPQNLKLMPNGQIVLLDFGLAKGAIAGMTLTSMSVQGYTPNYAPLEQMRGSGTDARSDLYSLAVSMHCLLTGQMPPDAVSRAIETLSAQPDPLKPAHEINPGIPLEISRILERASSLNQNERPTNAAVMRQELRRMRGIGPPSRSAKPIATPQPVPQPVVAPPVQEFTSPSAQETQVAPSAVPSAPSSPMQWQTRRPAEPERRNEQRSNHKVEPPAPKAPPRPEAEPSPRKVAVSPAETPMGSQEPNRGPERAAEAANNKAPAPQNTEPIAPPTPPKQDSNPLPSITVVSVAEHITAAPSLQPRLRSFSENIGMGARLEMHAIPGGEFLMGSPEKRGYGDEFPQHRVTLSSFYIGKYPVTQAQWRAVMRTNPSHFIGNDHPVDSLTWDEAVEFCRRLSYATGRAYRLPTEAEWEYACRAGTLTHFNYGDDEESLPQYAWLLVNSGNHTRPVGEKKPNGWGLYDMHGNVWEWCQDWYSADYYHVSPSVNPQGPNTGTSRVLRGGSWYSLANYCRSAGRSNHQPDLRDHLVGFRVVCEAKSP